MSKIDLGDTATDGTDLPTWDQDLRTVEDLLATRRKIVAANWYELARPQVKPLRGHPWATRVKKELKQLSRQCIENEIVEQEIFRTSLLEMREEEVQKAEASGGWERGRRVLKVTDRWAALAPLIGV
ncbi:MAG: hypothetical protein IIA89_13435 [Chloroflexi bacterium]|nr:hypothetical protein [Chloroflexota bacterium]